MTAEFYHEHEKINENIGAIKEDSPQGAGVRQRVGAPMRIGCEHSARALGGGYVKGENLAVVGSFE
jgi:hypothetical protein